MHLETAGLAHQHAKFQAVPDQTPDLFAVPKHLLRMMELQNHLVFQHSVVPHQAHQNLHSTVHLKRFEPLVHLAHQSCHPDYLDHLSHHLV